MRFDLTVDKRAEASIDGRLCVNCGKCGDICPTGAMEEYCRTVYRMFDDADGEGRGSEPEKAADGGRDMTAVTENRRRTLPTFEEAKELAVSSGCRSGCPLGIVPQAVAALVESGNVEGAYRMICEKSPLPWISASLCDNICGDQCKRGRFIDEAINMKGLERYVLGTVEKRNAEGRRAGGSTASSLGAAAPQSGAGAGIGHTQRLDTKVAVVGSGPAGLSAALVLAKKGHGVTIFEKDGRAGGALNWGVPDFRLDRSRLGDEIDRVTAEGVEIRYGCAVGRDVSLDELWREGFSACLIAAGTSVGRMPRVPGDDAPMIYDAVSVMRQINGGEDEGVELGNDVVVIGSGRLAADTARVIKRTGRNVVCALTKGGEEPGLADGSLEAIVREGIDLREDTMAKQIIREDGRVKAVELTKVAYVTGTGRNSGRDAGSTGGTGGAGSADGKTGAAELRPVKGSETNVFCDTVVLAAGRRCSVEDIGNMETHPDGRVRTDDLWMTNKDMVFACGDAAEECSSVAESMASGVKAAEAIDRVLRESFRQDRSRSVKNAPDISAIYPENVRAVVPQREDVMIEGGMENATYDNHTEDVLPILRDAGIDEEMERFAPRDEKGAPKRRIAVVGGGIAGMAAAIDLAKSGYAPAIFEKEYALGGSYRWLASHKRIDRDLLDCETAKIAASGIEVVYGVSVGRYPDVKELFSMGYEAVLFAIGESIGSVPDMDGFETRGAFEIVSLMGKLMSGERPDGVGRQIIVAGCDEMTFDAARLLKESCDQVTVLAPMSKGSLKASVASVAAALDEGVHLVTGAEPVSIETENGMLRGVKCRIREKNIMIDITCDTLVMGGTARPDTGAIAAANPELDMDEKGYIQVDDKLITSMYGVFAIGDLDMTSAEAGRAGAAAVKSFLESDQFRSVAKMREPEEPLSGAAVKYEIFEGHDGRESGFEIGTKPFDRYRAVTESSRCMGCGFHSVAASRCMGCGVCVAVCPAGAITMKAVEVNVAGEEEGR